jgi:PmbA protein
LGCSDADVSLNQVSGNGYTVRNGEPETIERNQDKGLDIRVYLGHQIGNASTTDLSAEAILDAVTAAHSIAKVTEGDPCLKLADSALYPNELSDLDLHHPQAWNSEETALRGLELATQCEAAAIEFDKKINNTEGASFSAHEGVSLMLNSNSFVGFSRGTRYGLSCSVLAGKIDAMQRDYWYDSVRDFADLQNATVIGETAAFRTIKRLDAQKITTRKAPVMFDATVAPSLLSHLTSAISGNAVYKKATFLSGKIDQQVFASHLTVTQQPFIQKAMGSALYDGEGVAMRNNTYIDAGNLSSYIMSGYSACKLGLKTTGNAGGVRNLHLNSTHPVSRTELLQKMGTGLLVTEMMGFGINIVTGDYSRGAAGYWVENGEIQYPVHEITLSGHLREMFMGIVAIADDVDLRGNTRTGSVLIEEMTIGGS